MANLVDNTTHAWIGGSATLIQMGDLVDRGAEDKCVLDTIMRLRDEASVAGGRVLVLLGNHEVMNARGMQHYVHADVIEDFGGKHGHKRSFSKGHLYGDFVRSLPVAVVEKRSLFVHAGLLPHYARRGIDALNAAAVIELEEEERHSDVLGVHGPVWTRKLVTRAAADECALVDETLQILGLDRMVVGHTPQRSGVIGQYCDGKLLVVDVGLSRWMYGNLALLELNTDSQGNVVASEIVPSDVADGKTVNVPESDAANLDEALKKDTHFLQHLLETAHQANKWNDEL